MPADPVEEGRVRAVLATYGLRDDLGGFDFDTAPVGAEGAYFPQTDMFTLPIGAQDQTIIHEGAHAEHYHAAGIVGQAFPSDLDTIMGALILSEAFVGFRLASISGFIAHERTAMTYHANTAIEVAQGFFSVPGARGERYVSGRADTTRLFMFLQRMIPLVVAEIITGQIAFTSSLSASSAHLTVMGTGEIILSVNQHIKAAFRQ